MSLVDRLRLFDFSDTGHSKSASFRVAWMTVLADLRALGIWQVSEWSSRSNGSFVMWTSGRKWPDVAFHHLGIAPPTARQGGLLWDN